MRVCLFPLAFQLVHLLFDYLLYVLLAVFINCNEIDSY